MEKAISSKQIEKMAKDIEFLLKEIERLQINDLEKTKQIHDLQDEIEILKENNPNPIFQIDVPPIFKNANENNNTNTMDITWVDDKKNVLGKNLKNLVNIMGEIENTASEKNKNYSMIPLLKATEKEFQTLEEHIMANKISIKFILFPTRKEYSYYKDGEVKKIKEKPKNYQFTNTICVKFDGSKFEKVTVMTMIKDNK